MYKVSQVAFIGQWNGKWIIVCSNTNLCNRHCLYLSYLLCLWVRTVKAELVVSARARLLPTPICLQIVSETAFASTHTKLYKSKVYQARSNIDIVARIWWSCRRAGTKLVSWGLRLSYQRLALLETRAKTTEWFSMSPLPRLHHHDIMTIMGLLRIICYNTSCNVGALKIAQCTAVVSSAL